MASLSKTTYLAPSSNPVTGQVLATAGRILHSWDQVPGPKEQSAFEHETHGAEC